MTLTKLMLKNFRNYGDRSFTFSPSITLLLGPNTAGKTNVLEALFLLATGKSFRAEREEEMLMWDKEVGRVKGVIDETYLEVILTHGVVMGRKTPQKKFLVNGVGRRMIDFIGNLRSVLFWPEDLELVTDSPSLRRRYLDFVLTQTDFEYRRSLLAYEKGLRQRNRLLERIRDGEAVRTQLMFWDHVIIKNGNYLTQERERYISVLNQSDKPFGDFSVVYDASLISEARLAQYADAEVAAGVTLVGPHRDDLQFFEAGRDMAKYGSRGEQRLTVLWLKLAELSFVEKTTGIKPLLLLDDIFSELDDSHRVLVAGLLDKQQTIVTSADIHALPKSQKKRMEVIELG